MCGDYIKLSINCSCKELFDQFDREDEAEANRETPGRVGQGGPPKDLKQQAVEELNVENNMSISKEDDEQQMNIDQHDQVLN